MFRHLVRQTVKVGEFRDFVAALKELNEVTSAVELPQYRAWSSAFGGLNEVWLEAEYDSLDAHVAAFDKARENETFMKAFRAYSSHVASAQDWPLMPIDLG